MRKVTAVVLVLSLGVVSVALDSALGGMADDVIPARNRQGAGAIYSNIAGQFRSVAANLLWLKADNYHHEYVAHNKNWTENTDLLPLMRMITWLDPHFTQAYASGAWMLGMRLNKYGQARAFLLEGLGYNPKDSALWETLAILAWRSEGNAKATVNYLKKAEETASTAFDKRKLRATISSIEKQIAKGSVSPSLGSNSRDDSQCHLQKSQHTTQNSDRHGHKRGSAEFRNDCADGHSH